MYTLFWVNLRRNISQALIDYKCESEIKNLLNYRNSFSNPAYLVLDLNLFSLTLFQQHLCHRAQNLVTSRNFPTFRDLANIMLQFHHDHRMLRRFRKPLKFKSKDEECVIDDMDVYNPCRIQLASKIIYGKKVNESNIT